MACQFKMTEASQGGEVLKKRKGKDRESLRCTSLSKDAI